MRNTRLIALGVLAALLAAGCGSGGETGRAWHPPVEPYAVGDSLTVSDWTIQVTEIDYDATETVEAGLAERGLSYDGTHVEGRMWVVARALLTYSGAEELASPGVWLEALFVDGSGNVYGDYPCELPDTYVGELRPGQTETVAFGIPVPPESVGGGWWAIGPAGDPAVEDLTFVR